MAETFVPSGSLRLWTEQAGDPGDPAVLLIMGASAQGITCPDELVARLVSRGVQVIRFDHRDTGRSSTVDVDRHPYTIADMAGDCLAVLDAYGLDRAHLVGASLGGVLAQWLGVHRADRVDTLTLLTTTAMGRTDLPPPAPHFLRYLAGQRDGPKGVETDVALFRVMNGDVRPFDEAAARAMLERAWSRAIDPSAAAHHQLVGREMTPDLTVPLSDIKAPTVVVHGDQDPIFPLAHGRALAAAIPGARLEVVAGMGHVFFSPGLPEEIADLIAF